MDLMIGAVRVVVKVRVVLWGLKMVGPDFKSQKFRFGTSVPLGVVKRSSEADFRFIDFWGLPFCWQGRLVPLFRVWGPPPPPIPGA